eukprot:UN24334
MITREIQRVMIGLYLIESWSCLPRIHLS